MYRESKNPDGTIANQVVSLKNGAFIPFDPANTDYQQYLAWIAEGNVPEPAENT